MFKQTKKENSSSTVNQEQNLISQGTKIKGDIEALGSFRIDGSVEGSVKTPGKVVIGKNGFVNGNLTCEKADIEGKYSGKMKVADALSLRSTAIIDGEVKAGKLSVEPGATFNASCDMNSEKDVEKPIEKKAGKKIEKKVENKSKKDEPGPGQKQKKEKSA